MSVHDQGQARSDAQAGGDAPASAEVPPPDDPDGSTILGFPAEPDDDAPGDSAPPPSVPVPGAGARLVVLRRADPVAGGALILAGLAAAASLWTPWVRGEEDTGLTLVRRALEAAGSGVDGLTGSGAWPALAIVPGGGVLLLLGLLLFRPARTHRLVGVLELFVAVLAAAGVLVRLSEAGWTTAGLDVGSWCAVAVAALGLLGALKAVLTTPRVALRDAGG